MSQRWPVNFQTKTEADTRYAELLADIAALKAADQGVIQVFNAPNFIQNGSALDLIQNKSSGLEIIPPKTAGNRDPERYLIKNTAGTAGFFSGWTRYGENGAQDMVNGTQYRLSVEDVESTNEPFTLRLSIRNQANDAELSGSNHTMPASRRDIDGPTHTMGTGTHRWISIENIPAGAEFLMRRIRVISQAAQHSVRWEQSGAEISSVTIGQGGTATVKAVVLLGGIVVDPQPALTFGVGNTNITPTNQGSGNVLLTRTANGVSSVNVSAASIPNLSSVLTINMPATVPSGAPAGALPRHVLSGNRKWWEVSTVDGRIDKFNKPGGGTWTIDELVTAAAAGQLPQVICLSTVLDGYYVTAADVARLKPYCIVLAYANMIFTLAFHQWFTSRGYASESASYFIGKSGEYGALGWSPTNTQGQAINEEFMAYCLETLGFDGIFCDDVYHGHELYVHDSRDISSYLSSNGGLYKQIGTQAGNGRPILTGDIDTSTKFDAWRTAWINYFQRLRNRFPNAIIGGNGTPELYNGDTLVQNFYKGPNALVDFLIYEHRLRNGGLTGGYSSYCNGVYAGTVSRVEAANYPFFIFGREEITDSSQSIVTQYVNDMKSRKFLPGINFTGGEFPKRY